MAVAGSEVVDNLLDRLDRPIHDLTSMPDDRAFLKLLAPAPKVGVYGEGLEANYPFQTGHAGQIARATKGDSQLVAGGAATAIKGQIGVKKYTLGLEFDDEDLKKMLGGRRGLHTTLNGQLKGALHALKNHQERLGYGFGDGALMRCEALTQDDQLIRTVTAKGPILLQEDDVVRAYSNRGLSTVRTEPTKGYRVTGIDHQAGTVELVFANTSTDTTNATNISDDDVLALSLNALDQSSASLKFTAEPMGLAGHLDPEGLFVGTASPWDPQNTSGFHGVETYQGLTARATSSGKMIARSKAYSGSPIVDQVHISYGPASAVGVGVKKGDLVLLMATKMWSRIIDLHSGHLIVTPDMKIKLPGGDATLPAITVGGYAQLPVLSTPYVPDGVIVTMIPTDFIQVVAPSGWVGDRGRRLMLKPHSSGGFSDQYQIIRRVYWNIGCLAPYRSFIVSGLDTTD